VKDLVEGVDRKIPLGLQTAQNVALARGMVRDGLIELS